MRTPSFLAVCSGLVAVAVPGAAFAQIMPEPVSPPVAPPYVAPPPASQATYRVPEQLEIGNQVFDGSLGGFRTYLDTKRATDPALFAQLDPQVRNLESHATTARAVMVAGAVVGLAFAVYAVAGQKTCNSPQVTDPDFAAKMQAWGNCNSDNGTHILTFASIGVGSIVLAGFGGYALSPHRSDLLNLVNAHNRISHEPIRLQLGYDPTNRLALGGVSTTF